VLINELPLGVFSLKYPVEIIKEIALHLRFVKEVVPFVDDALKPTASNSFSLFSHDLVELLFSFVLRVCIDVDSQ
jgi:hypothetical protein